MQCMDAGAIFCITKFLETKPYPVLSQKTKPLNRDYWWTCDEGHSWQASPANRNKGTECPYCTGKSPIPGVDDLASQAPELSKRLHPTKNGKKTAVDYFIDYTRDVWWECEQGHSFRASVRAMVAGWRCKVCDP